MVRIGKDWSGGARQSGMGEVWQGKALLDGIGVAVGAGRG